MRRTEFHFSCCVVQHLEPGQFKRNDASVKFSEFGRASLGTTHFLSFVFALPPPFNHDQIAST